MEQGEGRAPVRSYTDAAVRSSAQVRTRKGLNTANSIVASRTDTSDLCRAAVVILASTCAVSDRRRSHYLRPIRTCTIPGLRVTPPLVEVVCDLRLEHATLSANTPT